MHRPHPQPVSVSGTGAGVHGRYGLSAQRRGCPLVRRASLAASGRGPPRSALVDRRRTARPQDPGTCVALPRVTVTGSVADVRPWLAHATLAVVPLRFARGIQNKLLEAMAMQLAGRRDPHGGGRGRSRHTVSASDRRRTGALRCRDPKPARRPSRASATGIAGRRRVEKRYRWFERLSVLDHLLASAPPELEGPLPCTGLMRAQRRLLGPRCGQLRRWGGL